MVTRTDPNKWTCPYCNTFYYSRKEAVKCSEECALYDIDLPIEIEGTKEYYCDYCKTNYENKVMALDCEIEHINNQDEYYDKYQSEQSEQLLFYAANHCEQTVLLKFILMT